MRPNCSAFILTMLLVLMPLQSIAAVHPPEPVDFEAVHAGPDYPVGWFDGHYGEDDDHIHFRLIYPAMEDGESANMAGNGPFTWIQFIGDDGEELGDYMQVSTLLAKRGHIVVVHLGVSDATDFSQTLIDIQTVYEYMAMLNESNDVIMGSFGQVDLNHWGLGGHGHGAASAYGVLPFWNERSGTQGAQPPRGVFGLGADFSSWPAGEHWTTLAPSGWSVDPAMPSAGLFITGTLDGVSEFNEVTAVLGASDQLGWHAMQLLGANHYQFQDSTSFTEGFGDEDASITQEEQLQRSVEHVVPYLSVMLHGDHDSFRSAFNRPNAPNTLSDANAYLEENLQAGQFVKILNQTFAPANTTTFSTQDTVNWRVDWSLRNGTSSAQIPSNWLVEIECTVAGMTPTAGSMTSSHQAECLFPMSDVAPGEHVMSMQIRVEGAPTTLHQTFNRTDAPLMFTSPIPYIDVEQRSSTEVEANLFASDPDGQSVFFVEAEINGGSIEDFSASIHSDGSTVTIYHTADGEEVAGADVRLKVRAAGDGVVDEGEITALIRVLPVDDPVVVLGSVPMQNMVEDGPSTTILLSDYVSDPEGEVLFGSISGETQGQNGPVDFNILDDVLTMTPRTNMNGASVLHLLVGDGVNAPVELDVPLYIEALNDPMTVNTSFWDVTLDEDGSIALNLSQMAWDIDNDVLFWTISDNSPNVDVIRAASQILISGSLDYFGIDSTVYLNVSDGEITHTATMNITVLALPDAPAVTIKELNPVDDRSGGLMWWVYDPDGSVPSEANISINGTQLENLSHSCSFDAAASTNRCLTFLEYPSDANGTVELRVAVLDADLGIESAAYLVVNLSGATPAPPSNPTTDSSEGSVPLTAIGLVGGLLLAIAALMVGLNRRLSNPTVPSLTEEEVSEEISKPSEGGLLARAQSKQ